MKPSDETTPGPSSSSPGTDETLSAPDLRLDELLASARVGVRPGFAEEVMARLAERTAPVRHPARLAAAVVLGLVTLSTVLLSAGSASPVASIAAALSDFFASSLLAGSGLLGASWTSLGAVISAWLAESIANVVLLGGVVVGLNVLLFSFLRRRRTASVRARGD